MSDVDLSSIWFQTYKGNRFYPYKPEKIIIDIEEIAHALSNRCRWGGHSLEFYSVAQHSVLVSRNCPQSPTWGLLHDAAEAYYPDIPRPLKISPDIYNVSGGYTEKDYYSFSYSLILYIGL